MTIASQADLVAAVSAWLFGRTDLATRVPDFITLFEAKANRTLFCRQMEARTTLTCSTIAANPERLTLPADFQTMTRLRLINSFSPDNPTGLDKPTLNYASAVQFDELLGKNPAPNAPIWYTLYGSTLELCPTPDQNYPLDMVYRATIPPLTDAANWLLTLAPDAYLYGVLMEVAPYLRDDERIPIWKAGVDNAFADLNALSEKALVGAGPLTMRRGRRGYS